MLAATSSERGRTATIHHKPRGSDRPHHHPDFDDDDDEDDNDDALPSPLPKGTSYFCVRTAGAATERSRRLAPGDRFYKSPPSTAEEASSSSSSQRHRPRHKDPKVEDSVALTLKPMSSTDKFSPNVLGAPSFLYPFLASHEHEL